MQPSVSIYRMRRNGPAESPKLNNVSNQIIHVLHLIANTMQINDSAISNNITASNQLLVGVCSRIKAIEVAAHAYTQEA